jgi:hypothetical protein
LPGGGCCFVGQGTGEGVFEWGFGVIASQNRSQTSTLVGRPQEGAATPPRPPRSAGSTVPGPYSAELFRTLLKIRQENFEVGPAGPNQDPNIRHCTRKPAPNDPGSLPRVFFKLRQPALNNSIDWRAPGSHPTHWQTQIDNRVEGHQVVFSLREANRSRLGCEAPYLNGWVFRRDDTA